MYICVTYVHFLTGSLLLYIVVFIVFPLNHIKHFFQHFSNKTRSESV